MHGDSGPQPGGSMTALHHVMIAIPPGNEGVARRFYADILGLTEIPKPVTLSRRGGLWFQLGNVELHLGIDGDFHPARKAHVAFVVDDLSVLSRRLLDHGLDLATDRLLPGFDRLYLDDPFGNRLEFLAPVPL